MIIKPATLVGTANENFLFYYVLNAKREMDLLRSTLKDGSVLLILSMVHLSDAVTNQYWKKD